MMMRVTEYIYSIALAAFLSRTPGISYLVDKSPGVASVLLLIASYIFMHGVVNGKLQEIQGVNVAVNSIIGLITGAVLGYGVSYVTGEGVWAPITIGLGFASVKAVLTVLANRHEKPQRTALDTSAAALGRLADEINWTARVFPMIGLDAKEMASIKEEYRSLCGDYENGLGGNIGIRAQKIRDRLNALKRSVSARAIRGKEEKGYGYFTGCHTKSDLHKRYKELVKKYHPDNMGGNDRMFLEITKQYKELLTRVEA